MLDRRRDVIVIGASAGGLQALKTVVASLPIDLDAAVFIVLHSSPSAPSALAHILQRQTKLPVSQAADGARIEHGSIVVARPDYHLLVEEKIIRITRGPRENRHRPAIDALFRSAAHSHGAAVIAVVLTGALDDGTAGLWTVRDRGGIGVVQDPTEAEFPSMPRSALEYAGADYTECLSQLGALLGRLTKETIAPVAKEISAELKVEIQISREGRGLQAGVMALGEITPYTCPECQGVLVRMKEGGVPRFRCHTGHGYSINNLLAEVTEGVERSLWASLRSIEESAMLLDHLARHFRSSKDHRMRELVEEKAEDALRRADLVRQAVLDHQTLSTDNIANVKPSGR
jgi:two-component system, chemotaxis family, protein-glutamate methylesterase/glutaminase